MTILTEKQISKLKKMLIEQKVALSGVTKERENEVTSHDSLRDSVDELSTVDNHPADLATELYDREKDLALKVHSEDELSQVQAALERIENGSYGVCAKCSGDIPYDRLRAIPYTNFCIEHTEARAIPTDRPVEASELFPPIANSLSGIEVNDVLQDGENSFQVVTQYGSSDTPSDFEGDYDDLYDGQTNIDSYSELEILHLSTEEMLSGQISQQYADEARKDDYLE